MYFILCSHYIVFHKFCSIRTDRIPRKTSCSRELCCTHLQYWSAILHSPTTADPSLLTSPRCSVNTPVYTPSHYHFDLRIRRQLGEIPVTSSVAFTATESLTFDVILPDNFFGDQRPWGYILSAKQADSFKLLIFIILLGLVLYRLLMSVSHRFQRIYIISAYSGKFRKDNATLAIPNPFIYLQFRTTKLFCW